MFLFLRTLLAYIQFSHSRKNIHSLSSFSWLSPLNDQVGLTLLVQGIMSQPSLFSSAYVNNLIVDTRVIEKKTPPCDRE